MTEVKTNTYAASVSFGLKLNQKEQSPLEQKVLKARNLLSAFDNFSTLLIVSMVSTRVLKTNEKKNRIVIEAFGTI